MVSALDSGASGPGSSPGRGHYVKFLGKTLHSHNASLQETMIWIPANLMLGGNPAMDSHPIQGRRGMGVGSRNTPSRFMLQTPG